MVKIVREVERKIDPMEVGGSPGYLTLPVYRLSGINYPFTPPARRTTTSSL
ncbi:unnamed protein product [Ectocarpus sp. CCAP 1310/34]|nr:unnamed protein product [Ectocarpus sp. CCAP 1310/34]